MSKDDATTGLLAHLRLVADALDELGHTWALVGGLAVSVRCEPRFTRDIDIALAVDDDRDAEQTVADLIARGFRLRLSLEQTAVGRLAAVRLSPPGEEEGGVLVDLLFRSSGIESEICQDAERIEIARGVSAPVARAGHLLAMKLLAVSSDRPQDAVDIQQLARNLSQDDRERARKAVANIEHGGTNRGRRLVEDLKRLLHES